MPARTVSRVLLRRGQPRPAVLDPMTGQVIRSSKVTAVRYERSRPGELVHMDVKKLARIPEGGGWRAHGRAAGRTSRRATVVGYDYVHSLVDDQSRLAYSEIPTDEKGATCAGFLARAAAYFADHGIPRIERVMTDNAWAYRYSLHQVIGQLGARQKSGGIGRAAGGNDQPTTCGTTSRRCCWPPASQWWPSPSGSATTMPRWCCPPTAI